VSEYGDEALRRLEYNDVIRANGELLAENEALQRQVRELERLEQVGQAQIVHDETVKVVLQARITALDTTLRGYRHSMKIVGQHLTDAQQRITQLEEALNEQMRQMDHPDLSPAFAATMKRMILAELYPQHALTPVEVVVRNPPYKEWCRTPETCRGLSSCPLDPICAD
jgi:Fic family protein